MPDDPFDPRTGVLRNRLGITDPAELARAEARLAAGGEAILFRERPELGHYDLAHLQAIHRHLFGQVYDWAGGLRTVNMSKGATLFALAEWVEPQGRQLFDELARRQHLRGLDREGFVSAAGQFHSDLNALHPFRDGNGTYANSGPSLSRPPQFRAAFSLSRHALANTTDFGFGYS